MNIIKLIALLTLLVSIPTTMACFWLAYWWLTYGYGIHPALSVPVGLTINAIGWWSAWLLIKKD